MLAKPLVAGGLAAPAAAPSRLFALRVLVPGRLPLVASAWIATVCNLALWRALADLPGLHNLRGLLFGLGFAVMIAAATCALFSLFDWRGVLKPVIALFLFSAAFGSYFMLSYGVVIDTTMMVNLVQTDPREVRDLLSWRLAAVVGVLAVLPSLWLWQQPVRQSHWRGGRGWHGWSKQLVANALGFVVCIGVLLASALLVFQDFSSVMRNQTQMRYLINPLNSFYALGNLAAKPLRRDASVTLPLGEDARLGASYAAVGAKPPLLLLVLGETARSGNFGINGYARQTTPLLAGEPRVVSFRNAWSCGTSTAASVPCMFSHLGREGFNARKTNHENLLDVLQHAGLAVLWIDNQAGCKGVCERVPNVSTTQSRDAALCGNGDCLDEIMLRGLDQRIAELPAERRARGVVLVMHQMGSHGPAYYKRSPPSTKKFLPECASNHLQDCDREQLRNAFDNSIAYTDRFLSLSLKWLQAQEQRAAPAMLYVADHGESLGENNLYLHGLPYAIAPDVQKHVPWIAWLSPAFEQRAGVGTECLRRQRDTRLSHDQYFHSVLGLMDVKTSAYQPQLDLFGPCAAS